MSERQPTVKALKDLFKILRGKKKSVSLKNDPNSKLLSVNLAYFLVDFKRFKFSFLSDQLRRMLNVSETSRPFDFKDFLDLLHPSDKEIFEKQGSKALETQLIHLAGTSLDRICLEFFYRISPDGKNYFPVLHTFRFVEFDDTGQVLTGFSTISNVSRIVNQASFSYAIYRINEDHTIRNIATENFKGETSKLKPLSNREKHILQLLSNGLSSKQIGEELNISKHTVDTHRRNMLEKMQMNSSAQLVRFAVEHGIIDC